MAIAGHACPPLRPSASLCSHCTCSHPPLPPPTHPFPPSPHTHTWCVLQELPDSLTALSQLHQLSLSMNPLQRLPEGMERLVSLRSLELHHVTLPAGEDGGCQCSAGGTGHGRCVLGELAAALPQSYIFTSTQYCEQQQPRPRLVFENHPCSGSGSSSGSGSGAGAAAGVAAAPGPSVLMAELGQPQMAELGQPQTALMPAAPYHPDMAGVGIAGDQAGGCYGDQAGGCSGLGVPTTHNKEVAELMRMLLEPPPHDNEAATVLEGRQGQQQEQQDASEHAQDAQWQLQLQRHVSAQAVWACAAAGAVGGGRCGPSCNNSDGSTGDGSSAADGCALGGRCGSCCNSCCNSCCTETNSNDVLWARTAAHEPPGTDVHAYPLPPWLMARGGAGAASWPCLSAAAQHRRHRGGLAPAASCDLGAMAAAAAASAAAASGVSRRLGRTASLGRPLLSRFSRGGDPTGSPTHSSGYGVVAPLAAATTAPLWEQPGSPGVA